MINVEHQTKPYFAHAPGKPKFLPCWEEVKTSVKPIRTEVPSELTIITFNNGGKGHNGKELGLFEESLSKACVSHVSLGHGIHPWKNSYKIELLQGFLKCVHTPYILVADSSDVIILRELNTFLPDFLSLNCKAVFNAERANWPHDLPKDVCDFEETRHPGHYLNAGLWVAYTDFAKTLLSQDINIPEGSEQRYYKLLYRCFRDEIHVDTKCQLFQGLNRVERHELII